MGKRENYIIYICTVPGGHAENVIKCHYQRLPVSWPSFVLSWYGFLDKDWVQTEKFGVREQFDWVVAGMLIEWYYSEIVLSCLAC